MRDYPVRDGLRAWDYVLTFDRNNKGISVVPLSAITRNPDNEWVVLGKDGIGVPAGGTTGQVLAKSSGTDFETEWQDPGPGSGAPAWDDITGKPTTFTPATHLHVIADVTGLQTALDGKQASGAYLLPASIGVTVQGYSAATVIDAAYVHTDNNYNAAAVSKLAGISAGATVNSPDATLLNRTNHTGTQLAATISDFASSVAANAAVVANTAKVSNATHTGDATGATALTLATVNSNVGAFGSATQVGTFTVNAKGLTTAAANVSIQIAESQVTNLVSDLAAKAPNSGATLTGATVNGVTLTTAGGTSNFLRADGTYAAPPGGGGATNLTYVTATRVIESDTGTDATLPLVSSGDAGLAPASGGGTANFLRADGTWAAPAGGGGSGLTAPQVRAQNLLGF